MIEQNTQPASEIPAVEVDALNSGDAVHLLRKVSRLVDLYYFASDRDDVIARIQAVLKEPSRASTQDRR